MRHSKVSFFALVVFLMLAYLGSMRLNFAAETFSELQLLPKSQPLISFVLSDGTSYDYTEKNLVNKWSLIFFGFTHCPDICPLDVKVLGDVLALQDAQAQNSIQAIFISLDPERDALETIAAYTKNFNTKIKGITGANIELAKLTHFFGADYSRSAQSDGAPLNVPAGINMPGNIGSDYQVNHTARIFLINPQGEYVGSFPSPHNSQAIWHDLQLIIKR